MKRNILTIKQNTSGSRSGYGLISTPVLGTIVTSDGRKGTVERGVTCCTSC